MIKHPISKDHKKVQHNTHFGVPTVSLTDLDQGREILSRFSLPKSMNTLYHLTISHSSISLSCVSNNYLLLLKIMKLRWKAQ